MMAKFFSSKHTSTMAGPNVSNVLIHKNVTLKTNVLIAANSTHAGHFLEFVVLIFLLKIDFKSNTFSPNEPVVVKNGFGYFYRDICAT